MRLPHKAPTTSAPISTRPFYGLAFCAFLLLWPAPGFAQASGDDPVGASGLPLPRFASLQSDEVNLRTGPGTRYPIEWVYVREGLPLEITAEFDIWRRVRDWEGSEGWVHKSALTGKRQLIVTGSVQKIYEEPNNDAAVKAHAQPNAIGQLLSCSVAWCKVKFDDINGYMPKTSFWGAYSDETFN